MQNYRKNIVLVLDLDDTLYKEKEYVLSGINHIANFLKKITQHDITERLIEYYYVYPQGDFLEFACRLTNLPPSAKESLLWAYRIHYPSISLELDIQKWLMECEKKYHAIAILTDGRSITQRLKLDALKLDHLPHYISEDWSSVKPDKKRFIAIQQRWPNKKYVYIGDNPQKDFITPNDLGWLSIGLIGNEKNIYKQNLDSDESFKPHVWITNFKSIDDFLNNHKFLC